VHTRDREECMRVSATCALHFLLAGQPSPFIRRAAAPENFMPFSAICYNRAFRCTPLNKGDTRPRESRCFSFASFPLNGLKFPASRLALGSQRHTLRCSRLEIQRIDNFLSLSFRGAQCFDQALPAWINTLGSFSETPRGFAVSRFMRVRDTLAK